MLGDKTACPPLPASPSPPGLPVISGEGQWPISLAGALLGERARLFAHLASPEVIAGRRGGWGWEGTTGCAVFYLSALGADPSLLSSKGGVSSAEHKEGTGGHGVATRCRILWMGASGIKSEKGEVTKVA